MCVQEPSWFHGHEPCRYFSFLLSLLFPLCVKGPNHVRCWPMLPVGAACPGRTWAVWHIPGGILHLLGLVKQVIQRSGSEQLQWILSRKILFILKWEIFFIFVVFVNRQTCLSDPHYIVLTYRRNFLPSALPWQFEILSTFCILWTRQTICKQTAAAQKGERNFTIKGEIKLVSCSPAFDF